MPQMIITYNVPVGQTMTLHDDHYGWEVDAGGIWYWLLGETPVIKNKVFIPFTKIHQLNLLSK